MKSNNSIQLVSIFDWLLMEFIKFKIVEELYLIGSAVSKSIADINDVDVVQFLALSSKDEMISFSNDLKLIKVTFREKFRKSLHVTTFTQNEQDEFKVFMNLNQSLKIK